MMIRTQKHEVACGDAQAQPVLAECRGNILSWTALIVVWLLFPALSMADEESKSGLVAVYSDANNSIVRIVPTPDFRLRQAESIHPQLDPRFSAEWRGFLQINRAGQYFVHADGASVEVNGTSSTERVQLSTGLHPIRIQFTRVDDEARIALRWHSEFFRDEPVPSSALRHTEAPEKLAEQDAVEHGRFLFAELGCANCHAAGDWDLQSRRGPDLSNAGSRIRADWLYDWLKNPHQYRKSAVMPVCLDTDQDRADVTEFVMSLNTTPLVGATGVANPKQLEAGRALFEQVGCVKCHDKVNNLNAVGSKYVSPEKLAEFIADPHAIDPHGRMPQVFKPGVERHLAASVADFLFHNGKRPETDSTRPKGDAARGLKLFTANGCTSCHVVNSPAVKAIEKVVAGPAFGRQKGLPLRHFWSFGDDNTKIVEDHVTGRKERVEGRAAFEKTETSRGNAFNFDGKTFVELTHFHRPDTMTISVWVSTTQGGSILTWARPGGGRRGSRELRMNIGQDGRNTVCYGEYNSDAGWKPVIARPKVNLVDGNWHHLAVVRDGQSIRHYIDGKAQGGGTAQKGGGDYTDRLLIGALALQANPSNHFKGLIDDLSIWDMVLSAEQIATLAAGKSALDMATPSDQEIKPFDVRAGCLAADVKRPLPDYQLSDPDRQALQGFLGTVQPGEHSRYQNAPLTVHNLRIRQFRCTACHELNDQNVQKGVAVDDNGRVVRVERPPLLTGAGAKLTSSWLREVLLDRKRNRPWLNLRMPHFGEAVGDLPELISKSAGVPESEPSKPDQSLASAGLEMIGIQRGKVACITCHDYRGINRRKDGVVPAPDIADAARTVRHEWFERWMHDPQRLQPGTSMPQLFTNVSSEERDLRISQLWAALYYQKQLPLPSGVLDQQTEGTRIVVKDKPVIFRMATVTPVGQIDRAINVGIPGGFNFAFDPVSCRLRYAWKGQFLDAGPAWNGRGGNPVKAGTEQLVAIKAGHIVRIGTAADPQSLRFTGYRLDDSMPVFRYTVDGAKVEHRIEVSDSRIVQRITVRGPSANVLYVGDSETGFASESGQREADVIQFPRADVVEFEIEMPIRNSEK